MLLYVITEPRARYGQSGAPIHTVKLRLEELSGLPCLVQLYTDVTLAKVGALGVRGVLFGGYATPLWEHPLESFRGIYELAREGDVPILGLCGGHQLVAELWAAHNDGGLTKMSSYPIRKLRADEPDPAAAYHPGEFKEWGFHPIRIVRPDPLFDGLTDGFMASEAHRNEVKQLPEDFLLLASTPEVRVQAYRHRSRIIYGTQFHAENYTEHYPAGRRIIQNFFRIAGIA
ncbi:MAG: gamma-glutamyl-gamma-aminobutyrate hydrolase family protein [Armatimonadetes bacterium]|nr:gamma-glutamyl-gamma-aminobutyrate hydrolase family protein [Armatimonadota bacterium]